MRGNSQRERVINLFLFAMSLFIFCGCATAPIKIEDFNMDSYSTKIPLKIGLYMPSGFRNYVKSKAYDGSFIYGSIAIGDGLSIGAEKAFRELYREVLIIDGESSDILRNDIKIIISPEIVEARIGFSTFPTMEASIICKWTIVDPRGKIYYVNTITGGGTARKDISKAMTLAIKDHYQKLLSHMLSTKWWENIR